MAFLSSDTGLRPGSSSGTSMPNPVVDQSTQDLRSLTLQQQLLAAMQAPSTGSPAASATSQHPQSAVNAASNSATLSLYQQLLAQQNQQPQQAGAPLSTHQPSSGNPLQLGSTGFPQQFAALQQLNQLPGVQPMAGNIPASAAPQGVGNAALSALLASNPTLLQAATLLQQANLGGQGNTLALAAQLLMPNQQTQALQQQQQLLSVLQMLQNPATATLLAYQNYLQQLQQPHAGTAQPPTIPQPATATPSQLQLLAQLVGGGGNVVNPQLHQLASVFANQNGTNTALSVVDSHQSLSHSNPSSGAQSAHLASHENGGGMGNASTPSSSHAANEPSTSGRDSAAMSQIAAIPPFASTASTSFAPNNRQASSDKLLTSAESVQDHISRLISENEAIVEPNPVLLKRRPYHRQSTSNSLASQGSDAAGCSSRNSPGLRSPGLHQSRAPTTRSQSLHESSMLAALRMGGSLTSGQPIIRSLYQNSALTCNFCMLRFPNEAGLQAHESHCSKKEQMTKFQKQHSQPQLPISTSSLGTSGLSESQLLQQKLLAQHQSNISALVGAGAGVAPDAIINGAGNSGRSSVPVDSGTPMHNEIRLSPPQQAKPSAANTSTSSPAPSVSSENKHPLKKRLLEFAREAENASTDALHDSAQSASKVPKVEFPAAASSATSNVQQLAIASDRIKHELLNQILAQQSSSSLGQSLEQQRQDAEAIANLTLLKQLATTPQQQQILAAAQRELLEKTVAARQLSLNQLLQPTANTSVAKLANTLVSSSQSTTSTSCPKGMRDAILVALSYSSNKISSQMPYYLTLNEQIADQLANGDTATPIGMMPYRNRMRNITSDTFVCLHQTQPSHSEHKGNNSLYSDWKKACALRDDSLLVYTDVGLAKPRIKDIGCYSVAPGKKDVVHLRSTHSSFWVTRKQKLRNGLVTEPLSVELDAGLALQRLATSAVCPRQDERINFEQKQIDVGENLPKENTENVKQEYAESVDMKVDEKPCGTAKKVKEDNAEEIVTATTSYATTRKMKPMAARTEEVDVYVRGRGRGRYVCERCGIRCKKPSMLKKHLKSHTNVRPFTCITCNFSFKTKGNLTKHLFSKAHRRRLIEKKGINAEGDERAHSAFSDESASDDDRLVVDIEEDMGEEGDEEQSIDYDDPNIVKLSVLECKFVNDEFESQNDDDYESDNDDDMPTELPPPPCSNSITYRRFGQENILLERSTHTPPTLWTICQKDLSAHWPKAESERNCHSAPPVAQCSPIPSRKNRKESAKSSELARTIPHNLQLASSSNVSATESFPSAEHNFNAADISPPLSADISSNLNGLLANFIPIGTPTTSGESSFTIVQTGSGVVASGGLFGLPQALQASFLSPLGKQQENLLEALQRGNPQGIPAVSSVFELNQTHYPEKSNGAKVDANSVEAFLANEAQEYRCDSCERKFRKESDLSLHKQTHLIERQQNARSRTYQCLECRTTLRSKALLARHMETVHNSVVSSNAEKEEEPSTSEPQNISTQQTTMQNTQNNSLNATSASGGRSFVCVDCNLGFRTHGVLAKHLRSKNHVKTLANTGKLPEDAMGLIKDHSAVLANVDAQDCESARISILNLLSDLRHSVNSYGSSPSSIVNSVEVKSSSLECREQLGAQSPGPQTPNGLQKIVPYQKPASTIMTAASPTSHAAKRKNSERLSPGDLIPAVRRRCESAALSRPTSSTTSQSSSEAMLPSFIGGAISTSVRARGASDSLRDNNQSANEQHPLHSLAAIAAAAATSNGTSGVSTKSMVANVWVPPRLDQIEAEQKRMTPETHSNGISNVTRMLLEAAAVSDSGGLSNRSVEETSESTGRSESSTPVHRLTNGIVPSPMPASTRCPFCDITYETSTELQIHFHTEHIIMRDGKDYRCPRKHCEKVYPNRESLRAHFAAHYLGGAATPALEGARDEPGLAVSPSDVHGDTSPALRKVQQQTQAATAPSAPNHSPGIPEETQTVSSGDTTLSSSKGAAGECALVSRSGSVESSKSETWSQPQIPLRCDFCSATFADPSQLQKHWITHISGQARPHICKDCDAGFTTSEALQAHANTHRN